MKLGLCVLGCGSFAQIFAESLLDARDHVELYFASRDYRRAQAYSEELGGVDAFGSYEEAVSDSRVEAAYICTPHDLHLENARLAAAAKKHILVEKPLARTLQEGRAIIEAADDASVTLMVAENYRFLAPVQAAKRIIDSGALGQVRLIQLHEEHPFEPGSWRNDRNQNGGGVFIDGGIHKTSVLAYLTGRPTRVYAMPVLPGTPGLAAEDGMVVTTRSAEGVVGIVNHTWSISKPVQRPRVRVTGTLGNLNFELGRPWLNIEYSDTQETRQFDDDRQGIMAMVLEFRRSIIEKSQPGMTGEEGLNDLDLVLKAYESAESGLPVDLNGV